MKPAYPLDFNEPYLILAYLIFWGVALRGTNQNTAPPPCYSMSGVLYQYLCIEQDVVFISSESCVTGGWRLLGRVVVGIRRPLLAQLLPWLVACRDDALCFGLSSMSSVRAAGIGRNKRAYTVVPCSVQLHQRRTSSPSCRRRPCRLCTSVGYYRSHQGGGSLHHWYLWRLSTS